MTMHQVFACGVAVVALKGAAAAKPVFSWDTIPLYWYSTNPAGAFNSTTASYAARFPIIVPNGNHMINVSPSHMHEEDKLDAAARQLKALNGSSSIYFYLNTMMDWEQYSLHSWIAKNHPDWWVTNERNDTVCLDGQPLFNLTLPEVRAHWVGVAAKAMKTGLYDGVFADRANALPKGDQRQPGPGQAAANGIWTLVQNSSGSNGPSVYSCISPPDGRPPYQYSAQAYDEWAVGHAALYRDLQHAVGRDNVVVANNNNSDAANGRQFERWCNNDYDKRTIIQDVADLEQVTQHEGKVALVHGGEPCNASNFALSLAAFLIGAGEFSYFGCTDGWTVNDGWLNRPAEYDYLLGAPEGPAVAVQRSGGAADVGTGETAVSAAGRAHPAVPPGYDVQYRRTFGVRGQTTPLTVVTLALKTSATNAGAGCIYWGSGQVTGDPLGCGKTPPLAA